MRLGGPLFEDVTDPDRWVAALRRLEYRAAYCPVDSGENGGLVREYARAAAEADIVIAEVGAWSNPISPDEETRRTALALCQQRLALADQIGARCCVNIAGSRSRKWDGPHPENLSTETFDLIVESVRAIIDAVKPRRTFYALETMQWIFPHSPDAYLALIRAIDRERFAVHLDPVNLVCSPEKYYYNAGLIQECFAKLGPYIKCCHAKDIDLAEKSTVHLSEVRLGLGGLDYRTFLRELDKLDPDIPLLLEHLPAAEAYALAAGHLRQVAKDAGVVLR